jgi:hypothetical protein
MSDKLEDGTYYLGLSQSRELCFVFDVRGGKIPDGTLMKECILFILRSGTTSIEKVRHDCTYLLLRE